MPRQYRRFTARFVELPGGGMRKPDGASFDGAALRMVAANRWRPPVDLCETSTGLTVTIELAGLRDDDTHVTLFDDALVVEGRRDVEPCADRRHFHRTEIFNGEFRVEVPLPFAVDPAAIDATYHRGILRVELPRARNSAREELPALPELRSPDRPAVH